MKSIGGYFELECGQSPLYYKDGIYLNLCRSALRYFIRALGIKRIHIPYYTCPVVAEAIQKEGCTVIKYLLTKDLMPTKDFPTHEFILYNNYFGVLGNNVQTLANQYPNLIADNAQAFFSSVCCRASVYSPRKFFGLPDGGILKGKDIPAIALNKGVSMNTVSHLLKRIEYGAENGYADFVSNDSRLDDYYPEMMSNLTHAIMGNIDYEDVKKKRLRNFEYLISNLDTKFPVSMAKDDVPLVFPLYIENGERIRKHLISKQIFCAKYWPSIENEVPSSSVEYSMIKDIIAIPIDQRYDISDMDYILKVLKSA